MKAVINMYDFSENYKALIENIPSEIALLSNTSAFLNMMMKMSHGLDFTYGMEKNLF